MGIFHFISANHLPNTTSAGGYQKSFGSVVANLNVAEKGYMDVHLSVASPGGHSSVPPKHTVRKPISHPWFIPNAVSQSIGLLAAFITEIEANPINAKLSRGNLVIVLDGATTITRLVQIMCSTTLLSAMPFTLLRWTRT